MLAVDGAAALNGLAHGRPTNVLGGAEPAVDGTGERIREEFLQFLETYHESDHNADVSQRWGSEIVSEPPEMTGELPLYKQQLLLMRQEGTSTLYVDYGHLFRHNDVLAGAITASFYRFEPFLRAGLQAFVSRHAPGYLKLPNSNQPRDFWVSIFGMGLVHRYILRIILCS